MKTKTKKNSSNRQRTTPRQKNYRKILPRKQQRPFKNEELSIHKIRKDYEKFILPPKP